MIFHFRRTTLMIALNGLLFFMPTMAGAQCSHTGVTWGHHLWRVGFNNVESYSGSQVIGDDWANFYKYVYADTHRNSTELHNGEDYGYGFDDILLQWNDSPSSAGVGTYSKYSFHYASCGAYYYEQELSAELAVNQPTIGSLPYNNDLWYFGPGTPGAVPTVGGNYFYQYANLTFNKNCGGGDTCTGTPTWSESDPNGYISLSCTNCSNTTLQSSGVGNCTDASSISVSLNGWTLGPQSILVDSPNYLSAHTTIHSQYGSGPDYGYLTAKHFNVVDRCTPGNLVLSVPIHEEFSSLSTNTSAVAAGWNEYPTETYSSSYVGGTDDYTFVDNFSADDTGKSPQWNPDPIPPGPFSSTWLMRVNQIWYIGSSNNNTTNGQPTPSATVSYHQDHAVRP